MTMQITLSEVRLARPHGPFVLHVPLLRFEAGELVAITGPSGSGKTTLLHLVAGLVRADEGGIQVGTERVHALREGTRRRLRRTAMGLVFQTGALIPYLTILDNVLLIHRLNHPFRLAGKKADRARELLNSVGLDHMTARFPHQLSAGEQQRVALCRALLPRPGLLIADEPTANLDKQSARVVSDVLVDYSHQSGATVLCATHDDALIEQLTRRVVLREGVVQS